MRYTIVDYFGYDLPPQARMKAIKQAGFDGVILLWADYFDADYRAFPDYAAHEGLYVENAHAPYRQANAIWEDNCGGGGLYGAYSWLYSGMPQLRHSDAGAASGKRGALSARAYGRH